MPGTSSALDRLVQVTGCFKTQIDWLPLNTGSVRPTQGRTVMVAQVTSLDIREKDGCGCALVAAV